MTRQHTRTLPALLGLSLAGGSLAVALASSLGGCERRVVAARGIGAQRMPVSVQEPQSAIDRALFGEQESLLEQKRGKRPTPQPRTFEPRTYEPRN